MVKNKHIILQTQTFCCVFFLIKAYHVTIQSNRLDETFVLRFFMRPNERIERFQQQFDLSISNWFKIDTKVLNNMCLLSLRLKSLDLKGDRKYDRRTYRVDRNSIPLWDTAFNIAGDVKMDYRVSHLCTNLSFNDGVGFL